MAIDYAGLYPNTRVRGLEEVTNNLNKQIIEITQRTMSGLIKAAAHVRRSTENTAPVTPVDLGNLRASWFVVTSNSIPVGKSPTFIGYQAIKLSGEHSMTVAEAQEIIVAKTTGRIKFLMMGYSVNYALFVHEMIGADFKRVKKVKDKKTGKNRLLSSGPKWLETALKRETPRIIQIIKENASF
jgi:hypothetical protein